MNKEFIRQNYFELLLCIGITCGGLFRLLYPELRELEMKDLPIIIFVLKDQQEEFCQNILT